MRLVQRGLALSIGLALGRMLYGILSVFLGLVTVATIGMLVSRHWVLGSMLFIGGNLVHSWLCSLFTKEG